MKKCDVCEKRGADRSKRRSNAVITVLLVMCAFILGVLIGMHLNVIGAAITGDDDFDVYALAKKYCPAFLK